MVYKNNVKENLIGYKDEKNMIMNPSAQYEWHLIAKFEKKTGIKLENLTDDNEFFCWRKEELEKETTPLHKKIMAFLLRE